MSIYHCHHCDGLCDADIDGCNEHPNDECEVICDKCAAYMECIYEFYEDGEDDDN
jgi:hypothetical protein